MKRRILSLLLALCLIVGLLPAVAIPHAHAEVTSASITLFGSTTKIDYDETTEDIPEARYWVDDGSNKPAEVTAEDEWNYSFAIIDDIPTVTLRNADYKYNASFVYAKYDGKFKLAYEGINNVFVPYASGTTSRYFLSFSASTNGVNSARRLYITGAEDAVLNVTGGDNSASMVSAGNKVYVEVNGGTFNVTKTTSGGTSSVVSFHYCPVTIKNCTMSVINNTKVDGQRPTVTGGYGSYYFNIDDANLYVEAWTDIALLPGVWNVNGTINGEKIGTVDSPTILDITGDSTVKVVCTKDTGTHPYAGSAIYAKQVQMTGGSLEAEGPSKALYLTGTPLSLGSYTADYNIFLEKEGQPVTEFAESTYFKLAPCDHSAVEGVETITKNPTCTEAGSKDIAYTCAYGHSWTETVEIPATGHTEGETVPDSATSSFITYCSVCGEVMGSEAATELDAAYTVTIDGVALKITAYDIPVYSVNKTGTGYYRVTHDVETTDPETGETTTSSVTENVKGEYTTQTLDGADASNYNAKLIWHSGDAAPTLYLKNFVVDHYSEEWGGKWRVTSSTSTSARTTTGLLTGTGAGLEIVIESGECQLQTYNGLHYQENLEIKSIGDASLNIWTQRSGIIAASAKSGYLTNTYLSGKSLTLDANLTVSLGGWTDQASGYMVIRTRGADLTINGGRIITDARFSGKNSSGIGVQDSGNLIVNGGYVYAETYQKANTTGAAYQVEGGNIYINGGTVEAYSAEQSGLRAQNIYVTGGTVISHAQYGSLVVHSADKEISVTGGTIKVFSEANTTYPFGYNGTNDEGKPTQFIKEPTLGEGVIITAGKTADTAAKIEDVDAFGFAQHYIQIEFAEVEEPECEHTNTTTNEETITDATCTEAGSKKVTVTCECGEVISEEIVEIAAKGHQTVTTTETKDATCTEDGYVKTITTCENCGESSESVEEIKAKGHQEKILDAVACTCTATGLTEGKQCTVCNEITVKQEVVPAAGHKEEVVAGKAATCTETGLTDGVKCTTCGEVLTKQEIIPAKGHTDVTTTESKDATCTEAGYTKTTVTCTVCGETISETTEEIKALGHTEENIPGKAATCTETGLTEGKKCSVCGEILVAQEEIKALGHTEAEAVVENFKDSDLNNKGSYDSVVYCSVCNAELKRETIEIPVKEGATAEVNGKKYYTLLEAWQNATANSTIKLLADVDLTGLQGMYVPATTLTLDLNEKTLYIPFQALAFAGEGFTIKNGTIDSKGASYGLWIGGYADAAAAANVTIEDVTVNGGINIKNTTGVTLKNVTVNAIDYYAVWAEYNAYGVVIESGTYNGAAAAAVNAVDADAVTVKGGKFNTNVSAYCEEGFHAADTDGDGYFTIGAHEEETIPAKAATCTETGLTEGKKCSVCGEILVAQEVIPAKGHTEAEAVVENFVDSDLNNKGSYDSVVYCSVCDAELSRETIEIPVKEGAVAAIDGYKYATLQEAIDAAGEGATVTLLADIDVASDLNNAAKGLYNIAADDKITIDLNGKTINITDNSKGNFIVFYNYGELTIKNGTVNLTSTYDRAFGAQSTIILNRGGKLTVESGTYEHKGGDSMAFVLDNSANSFGDAYMTIKGGTFKSTYTAIRMRMADPTLNGNPGNGACYLTIEDGEIYGAKRGIWGQITNASALELGALAITGGTVEGGDNAIRMTADGNDNIDVTISGNANIVGVLYGEAADFAISGGTFSVAVPEELCAEGYVPAENEDGTYGVVEHTCSFTAETFDATCTEAGKIVYTCTCGESYEEVIPAKGHTEEAIPAVDATCTETGLTAGVKCSVCGEILTAQEEIPALGHTEEIIPAVGATCEGTGLTEGKKCSVCGEILVAQEEIPALGHTWGEGVITVAPTGTTEGVKIFTCVNDASHTKTEVMPVLPEAIVNKLGAITYTGDYYIYDLLGNTGNSKLTNGTGGFNMQVAMQFLAKDTAEEAANSYYGDYTTDFYIEINGITDGNGDGNGCYLAGYYATYGAWVLIPLDGFNIENGVQYPVITSAGFDFSYEMICGDVKDFTCGICFSDEFLAKNPDVKVTLSMGLSENIEKAKNAEFITVEEHIYNEADLNVTAVASVNGIKFYRLEEAIAYAAESVGEVKLLADITLESGITVTGTVVLDLNGKTISMTDASGAAASAILNKGNLTIEDSVGEGKITFKSTTPSSNFGYSTSTISNAGNLTVNGGMIENTTSGGASYAIDNSWYTQDVSLTVNGGTITATRVAVRQVPFSNTYKNVVTINGGTLTGATAGLQLHNYATSATLSEINITGGTFNGSYAFYTSFTNAVNSGNTEINISGGTFNGYLYLYNGNAGSATEENVFDTNVTGGTFNAGVYIYAMDAEGGYAYLPVISGGTFAEEVYKGYCAEGYIPTENEDGTYGVVEHTCSFTAETFDATCTEAGKIVYTCTCGESYEEVIPAKGHTEKTTVETVDATCENAGYIKTTVICEICGETLSETIEEIAALGHTYDNDFDATCNICGETREVEDGLIVTAENKLQLVDSNANHIYHRVTVYFLGDQTVADITDEAALKAIDSTAKTYWGKAEINKVQLQKSGKYVLVLNYNNGVGSKKETVCIEADVVITELTLPTVEVQNNKIVVTAGDATIGNYRAVVYYLGNRTVADINNEIVLKAIDPTAETSWGLTAINKIQLWKSGNYVIHLQYNVGKGVKQTIAKAFTVEFSELTLDVVNGKLIAADPENAYVHHRAVVYYVGDELVNPENLDEVKEYAITVTTYWGLETINKAKLTKAGNYVVVLEYNMPNSPKMTMAVSAAI